MQILDGYDYVLERFLKPEPRLDIVKHPAQLAFHRNGQRQLTVTSLKFTITADRLAGREYPGGSLSGCRRLHFQHGYHHPLCPGRPSRHVGQRPTAQVLHPLYRYLSSTRHLQREHRLDHQSGPPRVLQSRLLWCHQQQHIRKLQLLYLP